MGSLHGTPQPPAALCNPQQPHWPLAAPRSPMQHLAAPPYGLLQLSGADTKNGMTEIRTHALKKLKGRLFWANHYTMAALHLKMVECSIYT